MCCKFSSFRASLGNFEVKIEIWIFHCVAWFQGTKVPQKIWVGGGARPFEKINILLVSAVQCMPPRRVGQWLRYGALSVTYVTSLPGHMYPAYVPFIFVKMLIENVKKNNANYSNLFVFVDLKYITFTLSTWVKKILTLFDRICEALRKMPCFVF